MERIRQSFAVGLRASSMWQESKTVQFRQERDENLRKSERSLAVTEVADTKAVTQHIKRKTEEL